MPDTKKKRSGYLWEDIGNWLQERGVNLTPDFEARDAKKRALEAQQAGKPPDWHMGDPLPQAQAQRPSPFTQEEVQRAITTGPWAQDPWEPVGPPLPDDMDAFGNRNPAAQLPVAQPAQRRPNPFADPAFLKEIEAGLQQTGQGGPDEPFERSANLEMAQGVYDRKGKLLDLFANLTEGGQKFSNSVRTSGEIMLGVEPQQYEASALRDAAGRHREKISPAERDYFSSLGIEVPEGLTRSQLKGSFPLIQGQQQASMQSARMEAQAARDAANEKYRQERLALQASGQEIGRARLAQQDALARRPSEGVAGDLAALQKSISELDLIEGRKGSYDTGPLSSAAHTTAGLVGMSDADFAGFKARTQGVFNTVLKALAGSSVTGNEYARAKAAFPQVWDQDDVFLSKLKEFRDATRVGFDVLKKFNESRGSDMSQFNLEGGAATSGQWVPMINPQTGQAEEMHPDDVQEAEAQGWRRS